MPLRKDVPSPLHARNDFEGQPETKKPEEKKDDAAKPPAVAQDVDIDLDGFESRAVVLPPAAGNYSGLAAVKGKLLFQRQPRSGSADTKSPILYLTSPSGKRSRSSRMPAVLK